MAKAEMVLFKPNIKSMDLSLKVKLKAKLFYETNSAKQLGKRIDNKLNRKDHIDDIALKLNRANAVRDYVNAGILNSIYHALFASHIHYAFHYIGTECIHSQSSFHTSKESMNFDSF